MPTTKSVTEASGKRKASADTDKSSKRSKSASMPAVSSPTDTTPAEQFSIIDREFYPREMTNARCQEYIRNIHTRPIELLQQALEETKKRRDGLAVKDAVVHWFKCDLRTQDNRALHLASVKAKSKGVPLICLYIVSPQDFQAHITSPVRVDFILRCLAMLKEDLAKLDIPLYVETVEKRKEIPERIFELCSEWGASHLFANIEYEVDELRREAKMIRAGIERGLAISAVHDTCVVPPGALSSGSGNQYAVYSPWFRAWIRHVHEHHDLLMLSSSPTSNPTTARTKLAQLFEAPIPEAPANKVLSAEEKKRFRSMWPPGEAEARRRLSKFLAERCGDYGTMRNFPASSNTACLSPHFAAGTLSARSAIQAARDSNSTQKLDGGNQGVMTWISEVAWRDFYKHVLANWPFVCMNKPFKPEYTNIEWEYDDTTFAAWCAGRTGYPIVDAAMRQLNHTGWMHNRCRMIVASFLAKDLLLDWRMGERYFMEHLIDGDFASNNGGWGFSASTGVDPQPYFRIFNPLLQSEKFDADGAYIRKWIPELKDVAGKAIHAPYDRGAAATAKKMGYPAAIVDHKFARDRTLTRYKAGLGRDTS